MNRASSATGWVRNPDGTLGFTCSSKTGCFNGCPYCYARKLANGRLKQRYLANPMVAAGAKNWDKMVEAQYNNPFYPRFWPERLEQIRKRKKPAGIFLDDMSDWMGSYWPEEWTRMELQVMRDCPQHRFYTLTKQPQNLAKWNPFPDNCWVGVTATNMRMMADACYILKRVEAKVKYLSLEPFLNFERETDLLAWNIVTGLVEPDVSWLIIGAQTKPYRPPKLEWVQEIVKAADRAGKKVFLKDNLEPLLCTTFAPWAWGRTPLPDVFKGLRQEFPQGGMDNG